MYAVIIGLALWFVVSAWAFAGSGYADLALAVVSAFVVVATAIPYVLWRIGRRTPGQSDAGRSVPAVLESLREWLDGEFDTWQGQVKGAKAALEILLPLAAVAFGMTAFAIVLHFAAHG